jgi:hypothetical protein
VGLQQAHPSEPVSALDIDRWYDSILDRTLTARPQHFQSSELASVKSWAYKWLTLQRGRSNAQPPDDLVYARSGGVNRAVDWIRDHLQEATALESAGETQMPTAP